MKRRDSSHGKAAIMTDRDDVELSLGAEFDVFLNFRGPDTRRNFTDCLYHSMDGAGIHVFRDDEEIRKGEVMKGELERAIKNSTIFMPIFSKNYASSAWCLRELAFKVDCLRNRDDNAMILPIFFDVDPDDVKLKTRLYHDALQKHEQKFGSNLVQQWKEALMEVAHIKGWDLKDTGQGQLIRSIVAEVLIKMNKREKILPDHLVGIQDCVEDVMHLLDEGSPDVRYLVIHGMGGIGKTTLAKVVFNQISGRFDGCSFLLGVQEAAKDGKIVQLQKQLLSEILNSTPVEIFDSDIGINQIKRRFRHKKVLIVLDDLYEWDQLSMLAAKGNWFGLGSRIIITTRDTNNLAIEEYKIYQMTELLYHDALQLFSKHAFGMDSPPRDYDDISCNITRMTGGLPLALKVIGCSLYRKTKTIWKDMLKKLESIPEQHIYDKLKISIEMLNEEQREIFLDIACYYIGEERIYPYYMWKALAFYPKIEIDFLIGMSLIKINDDDTLLMHGLLRDLGREIVRREDVNVPGKRSRLWQPKIALQVVGTRTGTKNIIALKLTRLSEDRNFTSEEFSRLPSLRFLELERGNLVGDFKNLFLNLKWLSWHRCPSHLQAVNLCLQNLVVLKLSNSEIPENWNGWGPCLVNSDLQVIHLMRCYLLTTPDFSMCLKLRILVFAEHCPELPQIGSSIGKLERLKRLEIIVARIQQSKLSTSPHFDLGVVPSAICHLKNLSSLKLEGLCMRELHPSIGEMAGLTCLSLERCYQLRRLPDSIGKLRSLLRLNLYDTRIRELPDSIGDLKMLEEMDLGDTKIRGLPNSIGGLESLLDLRLGGSKITALPASIGYLKKLKFLTMQHSKIKELPYSIGDLKILECLSLGWTQIRELPNSIGGLESLLQLDLCGTKITELPASIGYLKRLKFLYMLCSMIRELPNSIGYLKMLEHLDMKWSKLRELPKTIGMLENLETLAYHGSRNMDMTWPPKLSDLHISGDDPQSLILPPQLSSFSLCCDDPQSIPRLPLGLHSLVLTGVKSPMVQPLLSELRYLSKLTLGKCSSREIVIEQLECLHHLDVYYCKSLVILDLSSLERLKELTIWECPQLIEIRYLEEMESLKELHIMTGNSIERLPKLSKLYKLRRLRVEDCRLLRCLPDLPNSLLSIGDWRSTESSPELSKHRRLRSMELSHCESLQGAVPNGWRPVIHACPLLGESGDVDPYCSLCRKSNPGLCARRRAMWR
ncbi:disease resistance protein RUN1 [Eucalyptus grandis]|uniref:disease resistance protein RUN1 n=1 Tax=Eucalyptus grandis TaxID=71139 RepID=UPI00192E8556|nr:disease resistance protein RUN1 [Eucalyptus grandis]XP_018721895.2 disease resistance protein RUN1 [Eucalyptus grandis]XP_039163970.1 disease resistance protein RUN1 [Eucalyptus grandis]